MSDWLIQMADDEKLWNKNLFVDNRWPVPITYNYHRLYEIAKEGNVYGCLLQIKDLYEILMRISVISALIYLDDKFSEELIKEKNILKMIIMQPLAMGKWYELSSRILKGAERNKYNLPESILNVLKATRKLYNKKVSAQFQDVNHWRNETIGHGLLRYEDNDEYKEEFNSLICNLNDYFNDSSNGKNGLYSDIYYEINRQQFCGNWDENKIEKYSSISNIKDIILYVNGDSYIVDKFLFNGLFFDSIYEKKKRVKYVDYISGYSDTESLDLFQEYIDELKLSGDFDSGMKSDYVLKSQDKMYDSLNQPETYIFPEEIKNRLSCFVKEHKSGIITLCMERGTGKTAFANSVRGVYEFDDEAVLNDAVVHTISMSATNLRGMKDFFGYINYVFENIGDETLRSSGQKLPMIDIDDRIPKQSMISFLNKYMDIYSEYIDISKLVLVIDGIDEITEDKTKLLEWLPTSLDSGVLNDGVYIIYTTRFSNEESVSDGIRPYIDMFVDGSDETIEIRRNSEFNIAVLKDYLNRRDKKNKLDDSLKDELIRKSDYRLLYLKIFVEYNNILEEGEFDERKILSTFLEELFSRYNEINKRLAIGVLTALAIFNEFSLEEYFEYISIDDITYRFIGVFNDLSPLLSSYSGTDGRVYSLVNSEYKDYILQTYSDDIVLLGKNLQVNYLNVYDEFLFNTNNEFIPDYNSFEIMMKLLSAVLFIKKNYGVKCIFGFLDEVLNGWRDGCILSATSSSVMCSQIESFKKNIVEIVAISDTSEMNDLRLSFLATCYMRNSFLLEMYEMNPSWFESFMLKILHGNEDTFANLMIFTVQEDRFLEDNSAFRDCYLKYMYKVIDKAYDYEYLYYLCKHILRPCVDPKGSEKVIFGNSWTFIYLLKIISEKIDECEVLECTVLGDVDSEESNWIIGSRLIDWDVTSDVLLNYIAFSYALSENVVDNAITEDFATYKMFKAIKDSGSRLIFPDSDLGWIKVIREVVKVIPDLLSDEFYSDICFENMNKYSLLLARCPYSDYKKNGFSKHINRCDLMIESDDWFSNEIKKTVKLDKQNEILSEIIGIKREDYRFGSIGGYSSLDPTMGTSVVVDYIEYLIVSIIDYKTIKANDFNLPVSDEDIEYILNNLCIHFCECNTNSISMLKKWIGEIRNTGQECETPLMFLMYKELYEDTVGELNPFLNMIRQTGELDEYLDSPDCIKLDDAFDLSSSEIVNLYREYNYKYDSIRLYKAYFKNILEYDIANELPGKLICSNQTIELMKRYLILGNKKEASLICQDIIEGNKWFNQVYLFGDNQRYNMILQEGAYKYADNNITFLEVLNELKDSFDISDIVDDLDCTLDLLVERIVEYIKNSDKRTQFRRLIYFYDWLLLVAHNHKLYNKAIDSYITSILNAFEAISLEKYKAIADDLKWSISYVKATREVFLQYNGDKDAEKEALDFLVNNCEMDSVMRKYYLEMAKA